jgi:hypothetical protein
MAAGDPEPPMGSPLLLLSYGRGGQRRLPMARTPPDAQVMRLYTDLSVHVNELLSPPTGIDVGFIDRSIDLGGRWRLELSEAVGSCQVFVPLISPSYLRSEWCNWEWNAFAERTVHKRIPTASDHESAIVPVIWVPTRPEHLPPHMQNIQLFSPEPLPGTVIARQYEDNGLYGLLTMMRDDSYSYIVWKLAQRIAEVCQTHWVEPKKPTIPPPDDPPPAQQEIR